MERSFKLAFFWEKSSFSTTIGLSSLLAILTSSAQALPKISLV
jgi:hypothetical protein